NDLARFLFGLRVSHCVITQKACGDAESIDLSADFQQFLFLHSEYFHGVLHRVSSGVWSVRALYPKSAGEETSRKYAVYSKLHGRGRPRLHWEKLECNIRYQWPRWYGCPLRMVQAR